MKFICNSPGVLGTFIGWLLHITRLPSFLVTLGTFFVLAGANLAMTRIITGGVSSNTISQMDGWDSAHAVFASTITIGSIQIIIPVVYWTVLTAVVSWVLLRTRVGNWVFAVGGDAVSFFSPPSGSFVCSVSMATPAATP